MYMFELDFYAESVAASVRMLPNKPRAWLAIYGGIHRPSDTDPEYKQLIIDHMASIKEAEKLVSEKDKKHNIKTKGICTGSLYHTVHVPYL